MTAPTQTALTQAALADLAAIALAMHQRVEHADDIHHQLAERAAFWARCGAEVTDQDVLAAIRTLEPDYQPWIDVWHAVARHRLHALEQQRQRIDGQTVRDDDETGNPNLRDL